ncbi:hypothetical protein HMPREF0262_03647 [Clostridium sp. ATCC 29733]|nr:hypothetical protein HMPREF0262_03647 [Clostridium sp. ATCC 29733]
MGQFSHLQQNSPSAPRRAPLFSKYSLFTEGRQSRGRRKKGRIPANSRQKYPFKNVIDAKKSSY